MCLIFSFPVASEARAGRRNVKELFSKAAKALSVYLDPYGDNELKRMELADKKLELENIKNNNTFDFSDLPRKDNLNIFAHEISHTLDDDHDRRERLKKFNLPKPKSNIGILPPDDLPPVAVVQAPEMTSAQRATQVASAMADGTQANLNAPRTARFKKKPGLQAGRNV